MIDSFTVRRIAAELDRLVFPEGFQLEYEWRIAYRTSITLRLTMHGLYHCSEILHGGALVNARNGAVEQVRTSAGNLYREVCSYELAEVSGL